MSLIPRNSLFDFDHFFDHFWSPASQSDGGNLSTFAPRIDVKEKGDNYEITAELPGVKKDDIKVTLENGVLSIEAESRQEDKEEKDGKVIRQERRYGRFMRSFNVGSNVTEADITANFNDGLLTLSAPKREPTEQQRSHINIG